MSALASLQTVRTAVADGLAAAVAVLALTVVVLLRKRRAAPPDNVEVPPLGLTTLSWEADQVEASLNSMYLYVEARTDSAMQWYMRKRKRKSAGSTWLRAGAIAFTTLGGLLPLVVTVGWLDRDSAERRARLGPTQVPFELWLEDGRFILDAAQLGYLFLGLAAACVAVDKFFGLSSGWMRYITTALALQRVQSQMRMDWAALMAQAGGAAPDVAQRQVMLQRLKDYVLAVDSAVEQETQVWISEFRTSLADIERTVQRQIEATRPGSVEVIVTNGAEAQGGWTVLVEGQARVQGVQGTSTVIPGLPPGAQTVTVTGVLEVTGAQGQKERREATHSQKVPVLPGQTTSVTFTLTAP